MNEHHSIKHEEFLIKFSTKPKHTWCMHLQSVVFNQYYLFTWNEQNSPLVLFYIFFLIDMTLIRLDFAYWKLHDHNHQFWSLQICTDAIWFHVFCTQGEINLKITQSSFITEIPYAFSYFNCHKCYSIRMRCTCFPRNSSIRTSQLSVIYMEQF